MSVIQVTERSAPGSRHPFNLFGKGFRPFFLIGAAHAVVTVGVWLLMLRGLAPAPADVAGPYWHAHEMLHGFAVAIIVGFLLTAVGNWTQRETAVGGWLAALVLVWLTGRVTFLPWIDAPGPLRAIADLTFLPLVAFTIARPIYGARNRRNYAFPFVLIALWATNLMWHLGVHGVLGGGAVRISSRVALGLVALVIVVVSGRIIPAFTRNATGVDGIESSVTADRVMMASVVALVALDAFGVEGALPCTAAGLAALSGVARAWRWGFTSTFRDPLLWVLHVGHAWVVVGFGLRAIEGAVPGNASIAWIHALGIGAIGGLTIGMMVRVARGHTGRSREAGRAMTVAFWAMNVAALVRVVFAAIYGGPVLPAIDAAGGLWMAVYATYAGLFAGVLVGPRPDGHPG
jgi:uncharacterized protein involved in response to NO